MLYVDLEERHEANIRVAPSRNQCPHHRDGALVSTAPVEAG